MKYCDPIHVDRSKSLDKSQCVITALQRVEINPVELCNRACVFCPRSDKNVYPNRNLHMTTDTMQNIAVGLNQIKYNGRLTFSGFGEPLLHENIFELIRISKQIETIERVQLITNGDRLNRSLIDKLYNSGVDRLEINMYDGPEQQQTFESMLKDVPTDSYFLRHHYKTSEQDYGLILNNRAGSVDAGEKIQSPIMSRCNLPFYKLMIDWNGDVLLCCQDWKRVSDIKLNVNHMTIREIWLNEQFEKYRERLSNNDRKLKPCNTCNINGTIQGDEAHELFRKIRVYNTS